MKNLMMLALAGSLSTASLAMASGTPAQLETVLKAGSDYGITRFHSIEFDDDARERVEVEGWLADGAYVELDMNDDGSLGREQRRQRSGEPTGLSAEELRSYVEAARQEGLAGIEEIDVDAGGRIEIDGVDEAGHELEIDFRQGDMAPVKVERDQ
ncbi:MAG: hypothetical protein CME38_01915 [Haliea sp.]|nr:hypothetical protein [Haliea sp.]|tara:strand:+ start:1179 stop:1643 length:465 start_codon:yes stop_codon:yes gene_type:complete